MTKPETALEDLLSELFDPPDLRRFLRRHLGDDVVGLLPESPENEAEVMHQAVRRLKQRGEIDGALFTALKEVFPKRVADIAEVEALMSALPSESPTTSASRKPASRARVDIEQDEVEGVGAHVKASFDKDASIRQGVVRKGGTGVILGD
ncbi:MAG: hypothetical protein H6741_34000 [Alphaproteobacteria bacterium]|nr:hypothetical protein [Alphaproteobacteria bacterium]MCB9797732.1 hypothetical protein [Alphaproteobacteria bacterium]